MQAELHQQRDCDLSNKLVQGHVGNTQFLKNANRVEEEEEKITAREGEGEIYMSLIPFPKGRTVK
jgi:hypothetical protein